MTKRRRMERLEWIIIIIIIIIIEKDSSSYNYRILSLYVLSLLYLLSLHVLVFVYVLLLCVFSLYTFCYYTFCRYMLCLFIIFVVIGLALYIYTFCHYTFCHWINKPDLTCTWSCVFMLEHVLLVQTVTLIKIYSYRAIFSHNLLQFITLRYLPPFSIGIRPTVILSSAAVGVVPCSVSFGIPLLFFKGQERETFVLWFYSSFDPIWPPVFSTTFFRILFRIRWAIQIRNLYCAMGHGEEPKFFCR